MRKFFRKLFCRIVRNIMRLRFTLAIHAGLIIFGFAIGLTAGSNGGFSLLALKDALWGSVFQCLDFWIHIPILPVVAIVEFMIIGPVEDNDG